MALRESDCTGVWVPVVTPFRDDALDLGRVTAQVDSWIAAGIRGFLALGTTGEAPHLSDAECVEVVVAYARAAAGRVPFFAGSGRGSTAAAVELGRRLAEAGADALMVLTPHAYRSQVDADTLRRHYESLASQSPVPVFVYHMPGMTGLDLDPEVLADLVRIPNIWGFKDSAAVGGPLAATLRSIRTLGFVGNGLRLVEGLEAGAIGGILAIANAAPEPCVAIDAAWRAADVDRARRLQASASEFVNALQPFGVAGIKEAMAARGWDAGTVRSPLRRPDPAARLEIARALERFLAAV